MVARVVDFVDMHLPAFDIVSALKHSVMNSPSFRWVSDDMRRTIDKGCFWCSV